MLPPSEGEELLVSGPSGTLMPQPYPLRHVADHRLLGKKSLKRKASSTKTPVAPASEDAPTQMVAISAPPLSTRKRQLVQDAADDIGHT